MEGGGGMMMVVVVVWIKNVLLDWDGRERNET